jgi:fused signal recognition particle receptor
MLKFLKRRKTSEVENNITVVETNAPDLNMPWFKRLTKGLGRTRSQLGDAIGRTLLGAKAIDDDLLETIETQLLQSDVGIEASEAIIDDLTQRLSRKTLADANAVLTALQENLYNILAPCVKPLTITTTANPYVILMVGVNGNGKTTTIGKLAMRLQQQGHRILLAAGDTFRAAAVEQLQAWGRHNNVDVIAQGQGADSASVIYDAVQAVLEPGK